MHAKGTKSAGKAIRAAKITAKKTKTIKQREFLPVDPAEIYDAFLNEQKHSDFTGAKATCDRRVGGKFTAWDGYIRGTNLRLENGRRIVQEWKTTEWPEGYPPSLIEFTFKPKAGGTEVKLVQKNVPANQAKEYEKGWTDFYWNPLKKYFDLKK